MDALHLYGVEMIQFLQTHLSGFSGHMLFASHLGDPRNAFLLYFPLAYFLSPPLGVTVMWVAALSEWLNAVLKWLLFGHRPYWWVNVTSLYTNETRPQLTQYHLTCETGPGSPSGHAMCTAAVLFVMVAAFVKKYPKYRMVCWMNFAAFMTAVCVSRLFIVTHFPHQVIAGTITGCLLSYICARLNLNKLGLGWYFLAAVVFLTSSPAMIKLIGAIGWDATWSVALAKKWCAKSEWVYLDTTPLYAVTRDASQLLGLGIAMAISPPKKLSTALSKGVAITLSTAFTRGMEYVVIPQSDPITFYILAFVKNFALPIVVVLVIPKVLGLVGLAKVKNG